MFVRNRSRCRRGDRRRGRTEDDVGRSVAQDVGTAGDRATQLTTNAETVVKGDQVDARIHARERRRGQREIDRGGAGVADQAGEVSPDQEGFAGPGVCCPAGGVGAGAPIKIAPCPLTRRPATDAPSMLWASALSTNSTIG